MRAAFKFSLCKRRKILKFTSARAKRWHLKSKFKICAR
nr:MAG TPA: hypothetical protein [Inoviridae sp.]